MKKLSILFTWVLLIAFGQHGHAAPATKTSQSRYACYKADKGPKENSYLLGEFAGWAQVRGKSIFISGDKNATDLSQFGYHTDLGTPAAKTVQDGMNQFRIIDDRDNSVSAICLAPN